MLVRNVFQTRTKNNSFSDGILELIYIEIKFHSEFKIMFLENYN